VIAYLGQSVRNGWRPDEPQLKQVLDSLPGRGGSRGEALLELLRQASRQQVGRLAAFEPLLKGGDAQRGRKLFFGKKVACATCHRVGREGGQVGPDLTKLGAIRAGRDILESILFPSATIAQGYDSYYVLTAEGRAVTGILARQSADVVVLRDSSGAEVLLPKDRVEEMKRLPTSLMPEGQERALTRDEFRDLLAFLQNLK
jgi:putative heme-binding domain-containing protein